MCSEHMDWGNTELFLEWGLICIVVTTLCTRLTNIKPFTWFIYFHISSSRACYQFVIFYWHQWIIYLPKHMGTQWGFLSCCSCWFFCGIGVGGRGVRRMPCISVLNSALDPILNFDWSGHFLYVKLYGEKFITEIYQYLGAVMSHSSPECVYRKAAFI